MVKLTDRFVKALKPTGKRYLVRERDGFGVRVSKRGTRSWVFVYDYLTRRRRMTLGTYPEVSLKEARALHARARALLAQGIDPAAARAEEKRREEQAYQERLGLLTVEGLARDYLEHYAKLHKRSWREDQRILEKDVLPRWGHRPASELTRHDVLALQDAIAGPPRSASTSAKLTLAIVQKMFSYALERDLIPASPCAGVRIAVHSTPRDRVLDEAEIKAFWNALQAPRVSSLLCRVLRFQLLTAQRVGEVAGLSWEELDLEEGWWTIPAERAKNGLSHRVPLTNTAREQVLALGRNGSSWVFASPVRDGHVSRSSVTNALRRHLPELGVAPFTPHDLRRTAASHMARLGVPRLVLSRILNHREGGVTRIYDRWSYDQEKREALDRWNAEVRRITASCANISGPAPTRRSTLS